MTDNGPDPASGVTLTVPVPAGVSFRGASGGVVPVGGVLTFKLDNIRVGASTPVVIELIPTAVGTVTLAATATADGSDPVSANNTASPSIPVPSDGPTVLSVQRYGYHAQPTFLYLTFSSPLATTQAVDTTNYRVYRARASWGDARPGHRAHPR